MQFVYIDFYGNICYMYYKMLLYNRDLSEHVTPYGSYNYYKQSLRYWGNIKEVKQKNELVAEYVFIILPNTKFLITTTV